MSIISIKFIFFTLLFLLLYYLCPKKCRYLVLLLGSIIFYFLSSQRLIIFIILSIISIYFTAISISNFDKKIKNIPENLDIDEKNILKAKYKRKKKIILSIGILLNIGFILFTKYYSFLLFNVNHLLDIFGVVKDFKASKYLLPIGISYYTLEAISYMTDVYRGKVEAEKNIFKISLYLLYFPKIMEGPICRYNEMKKEFFEVKKIDFKLILIGMDLIVLGLFKKMVIADRAGIFVNNVLGNNINGSGLVIVLCMILYTIELYAEFSGMIDIIRGVSYLFNIKLPENFKRPFFSKSIQEFWRLWHISLGNWLRDYIFYPISLSKFNMKITKYFKEHFSNYIYKFICAALPLIFVWFINGLWHGTSYKFVAYGMYYYIIMMIGILIKPLTDKFITKFKINDIFLKVFRTIRTLILVVIGMTLFRANSVSNFIDILSKIFTKTTIDIYSYGLTNIDMMVLLISNLFILLIGILSEKGKINIENSFTDNVLIRATIYTLLIIAIVVFGCYGSGYNASDFVYGM